MAVGTMGSLYVIFTGRVDGVVFASFSMVALH